MQGAYHVGGLVDLMVGKSAVWILWFRRAYGVSKRGGLQLR